MEGLRRGGACYGQVQGPWDVGFGLRLRVWAFLGLGFKLFGLRV